jgi:hypothetical protein
MKIQDNLMADMTPAEVLAHTWLQKLITVDDGYAEYPDDVKALAREIEKQFGKVKGV